MDAAEEGIIAEYLEDLKNRVTCKWCKHPRLTPMPRTGLCRSCNRLRLNLQKLEKYCSEFEKEHGGLNFILSFDLKVQRTMVESAKAEGRIYGDIATDDITGLDLEHELNTLGKRFVRKEFFRGHATYLDWAFCLNHRRYLCYILSLFIREDIRKKRRIRAMNDVVMDRD